MGEKIQSYRELKVYQKSFELQQLVFVLTKGFPPEERYSLTDQVRRSSRSIGSNIAEAWHKRRYTAHFVSKLTDADGEQAETQHWAETSLACAYLSTTDANSVVSLCRDIGRMLGKMMSQPEKWCAQ